MKSCCDPLRAPAAALSIWMLALGISSPLAYAVKKRLPSQVFRNACIAIGCQKFARRDYSGDLNIFKITEIAWQKQQKGLAVKVQSAATIGLPAALNPEGGKWFSFHLFDHKYVAATSAGLSWPKSYQILRAADEQATPTPEVSATVGLIGDAHAAKKFVRGSIDQRLGDLIANLPSTSPKQLRMLNGMLVRSQSKLTFTNPEFLAESHFLGRRPLQNGMIKRPLKLLDGTLVWLVSHGDGLAPSAYLSSELSTVK